MKGKKGNAIADSLLLVLAVFVFIVVAVFANNLLNDFNTEMQADSDMSTEAKAELSSLNTKMPTTFDYAVVTIFVLMWIGAIISSFLIDTHPAFMVLSLILLLVLIVVPMHLANFYEDLVTDPDIDAESTFPLTTFLMQHFAEYFFVVGISIIGVLYGKARA